jgi:hypothetical protein
MGRHVGNPKIMCQTVFLQFKKTVWHMKTRADHQWFLCFYRCIFQVHVGIHLLHVIQVLERLE